MRRIVSDPIGAVLEELESPVRLNIANNAVPRYRAVLGTIDTTFSGENAMMQRELRARVEHQTQTPIGFLERLVLFWSNHFNMTIEKHSTIRAAIGQYERGVVRRHVLGSFDQMLTSTIMHPTMLAYLDNADSMGPNSVEGRRSERGLNVNLGREILELHTVGVGAGYTEEDIYNLACALTGWGYIRGWEARNGANGGNAQNRGLFNFRPRWHEPGSFSVMNRRYGQAGVRKGQRVLEDLGKHPATAQHIAFKLIQHFLTDEPTPDLVDPVARAFIDSEGDLKETAKALVHLPASWTMPMTKLRRPYELLIAQMRALGANYHRDDEWRFDEALKGLGNQPWRWSTPDGFPDENAHWASPDAIRVRADAIQMTTWALTHRDPFQGSPARRAEKILGARLDNHTLRAIQRTRNKREALNILFLSPEFQRR